METLSEWMTELLLDQEQSLLDRGQESKMDFLRGLKTKGKENADQN